MSSAKGSNRPLTYKEAGVDIEAGNALVDAIKPVTTSTRRPGADGALGGFGGLFDPRAAGFTDPILVAATDGVGTKLSVAIEAGRHDTVGVDLVAMCVNDLVVQGAEPLFFLDYYATGKLDIEVARAVVEGIGEGCRQAGCALIGGETAEMPGMYGKGDYDLAGFTVGAAERGTLLDGTAPKSGDVVLGLASNGVHSNGFSLVRRVVGASGLTYSDPAPFDPDMSLGEALLAPTRIYVRSCLYAIRAGGITGLAHITGGGLIENPPRSYTSDLTARLDLAAWPLPPVFTWLADTGGIEPTELARTFNCGIGMTITTRPEDADRITNSLTQAGETVYRLGALEPRVSGQDGNDQDGDGQNGVILENLGTWRR